MVEDLAQSRRIATLVLGALLIGCGESDANRATIPRSAITCLGGENLPGLVVVEMFFLTILSLSRTEPDEYPVWVRQKYTIPEDSAALAALLRELGRYWVFEPAPNDRTGDAFITDRSLAWRRGVIVGTLYGEYLSAASREGMAIRHFELALDWAHRWSGTISMSEPEEPDELLVQERAFRNALRRVFPESMLAAELPDDFVLKAVPYRGGPCLGE